MAFQRIFVLSLISMSAIQQLKKIQLIALLLSTHGWVLQIRNQLIDGKIVGVNSGALMLCRKKTA